MSEQRRREHLPVFNNLWNMTPKITSWFGHDLGFEFDLLQQGLYLIISVILCAGLYFLLSAIKVIWLLSKLPLVSLFAQWYTWFLVFPIALSTYLYGIKIDGKQPYRYIYDYARFIVQAKHFQNYRQVQTESYRLIIKVPYRVTKHVDLFDQEEKTEKAKFRYEYD